MCAELDGMIDAGKAPMGVLHPKSLPKEGLYSLDVDALIWDDSGLNDSGVEEVPQWLGNDKIRRGIPAWLTVKRCDEELRRLRGECARLQQWAKREWDNICRAPELIGLYLLPCHSPLYHLTRHFVLDDPDIRHYILTRRRELEEFIISWRESTKTVCPEAYARSWGPSTAQDSSSCDERSDSNSESDETGSDDSTLLLNDRILQAAEGVKGIGSLGAPNGDDLGDDEDSEREVTVQESPSRKRPRR